MNCRNWLRRAFLLGAMSGTTAVVVCFGDVVVRETQIGPMPTDWRQLAITPDGNHAAVVGMGGSRPAVYVDGNVGSPYSAISPWTSLEPGKPAPGVLVWSPDHAVLAYVASKGGQFSLVENQREGPAFDRIIGVVFSPVGHRVAYIAQRGIQNPNTMESVVVVDGRVGPGYRSVQAVQFSEDGQHVGYFASSKTGSQPNHVVFDGHEGPGFGNLGDLHLSPSGGHYAYVGDTLKVNKIDKAVIVDGTPGPAVDQVRGIVFSRDGKRVAYFAQKSNAGISFWQAIVDGRAGPEFLELPGSSVVFSADGKRTAYTGQARSGDRYRSFAVIDGNKGIDYDDCSEFLFSADSRHVAYLGTNSGKAVVVLDGKESDAHQAIDRTSLRFSPDGSRFGFVAQDESTWRVVIDGKAGEARHEVIDGKSLEFSPDGQHYRFKIRNSSGDWNFVVDDRVDKSSAPPAKMAMTRDWRHSAAVVQLFPGDSYHEALAKQSGQPTGLIVSLDGKTLGSGYDYVDLLEISPDGSHAAYTISKREEAGKNSYHVVVDGHEQPTGYFRITKILFSPDSQHIAYVAWADGSKQSVVVDGFTGPVFDTILGSPNEQPGAIQFRPDGSLDYYATKDGKLTHVMFDAATIASLPKPAAGGVSVSGYAEVYAFGSVPKDGGKPAVLAAAPDGTLFGATSAGGQYRNGVIFRMRPDGSDYRVIYQILGGQNDGAYPSTLLVARDGTLYGTFLVQGPTGSGSIFRCAADGSDFQILHAAQPNLDGPEPKLIGFDSAGNIIGVSGRTSMSMPTHLFRMTPTGEFTLLLDTPFKQGDYNGLGPISDGHDGYLYGVFAARIFKVKNDGTGYTVLRKFKGAPLDATGADHPPIVGSDGRLYGEANGGGQAGSGIIYSLNRDGSDYKVIVDPESERLDPKALVEGTDGKLYAIVDKGIARLNKDGSDYSIVRAGQGSSFVAQALVKDNVFYTMQPSGGKGSGAIVRYGLAPAAASTSTNIVIKEVPAAPLPPVDLDSGSPVSSAETGHDVVSAPSTVAVEAPASASVVTTAQPAPAGPKPVAGAPTSAPQTVATAPANNSTGQTPNSTADATQAALQKVEAVGAQVGTAATKAKAKAEQAAAKAKNWLDSLKQKKP